MPLLSSPDRLTQGHSRPGWAAQNCMCAMNIRTGGCGFAVVLALKLANKAHTSNKLPIPEIEGQIPVRRSTPRVWPRSDTGGGAGQ